MTANSPTSPVARPSRRTLVLGAAVGATLVALALVALLRVASGAAVAQALDGVQAGYSMQCPNQARVGGDGLTQAACEGLCQKSSTCKMYQWHKSNGRCMSVSDASPSACTKNFKVSAHWQLWRLSAGGGGGGASPPSGSSPTSVTETYVGYSLDCPDSTMVLDGKSKEHCSRLCQDDDHCRSFSFKTSNKRCKLHGQADPKEDCPVNFRVPADWRTYTHGRAANNSPFTKVAQSSRACAPLQDGSAGNMVGLHVGSRSEAVLERDYYRTKRYSCIMWCLKKDSCKYAQFRKYKEDDASGLTAKAACVLFEQTDFSAACSAGGSTGEYEVWNIYPPSA